MVTIAAEDLGLQPRANGLYPAGPAGTESRWAWGEDRGTQGLEHCHTAADAQGTGVHTGSSPKGRGAKVASWKPLVPLPAAT